MSCNQLDLTNSITCSKLDFTATTNSINYIINVITSLISRCSDHDQITHFSSNDHGLLTQPVVLETI